MQNNKKTGNQLNEWITMQRMNGNIVLNASKIK